MSESFEEVLSSYDSALNFFLNEGIIAEVAGSSGRLKKFHDELERYSQPGRKEELDPGSILKSPAMAKL